MKTRTISTFINREAMSCGEDIICSEDLLCGDYIEFRYDEVVWFGSTGKNPDGTAIKAYDTKNYDKNNLPNRIPSIDINYSKDLVAVYNSLQQKLQVIKGELLYHSNFGVSLFDKSKSKLTIDSSIVDIINDTNGVKGIINFNSYLDKNRYFCEFTVNTIYGNLKMGIQ